MAEVFDLAQFKPNTQMQSVIDRYEDTPTDELLSTQALIYDPKNGLEALLAVPYEGPGIKESDFVIAQPLAFGNDINSKFNKVRAQYLADVHGVPVYEFSSPIDARNFDPKEQKALNDGDWSPYSERYFRFIDKSGMETGRIAIVGFSMSASVGANATHRFTDHFDVDFSVLGDPANVVNRSLPDLMGAFNKHGFSEVARNVKNAGLRPYSETQKVDEQKNFVTEQLGLLRYVGKIASKGKSNMLAANALRRDTFKFDLTAIERSRVPTLVAYGADSAITPATEAQRLQESYEAENISWLRVEDSDGEAGHTWGDHITAWTYITTLAQTV